MKTIISAVVALLLMHNIAKAQTDQQICSSTNSINKCSLNLVNEQYAVVDSEANVPYGRLFIPLTQLSQAAEQQQYD